MKWFLGNNFKISSEKWNETCSELISSPSLSLSDASVLFYFACVRVRFVSIYFYKRLVFFSDFYTREQPMCNQKLPFCPLCLVCTVFFFSNYIIFFFSFLSSSRPHTHTHTKQLLTSDPDVYFSFFFHFLLLPQIFVLWRFCWVFILNFFFIWLNFIVKQKVTKMKDIYINEYI